MMFQFSLFPLLAAIYPLLAQDAEKEASLSGQIFIQGDMLLEPVQYRAAYQSGDHASFAGAALEDEKKRWPKGVIPYKVDSSLSKATKRNLQTAMERWSANTCIKFYPVGHPETAGAWGSIKVMAQKGCWASVGRRYTEAKVSLGRGCETAAAHELGHVIGLHHEQCRTDRDKYVKILMGKVSRDQRYNFEIATGISNFSVPYDFCSIMHYGTTAMGMGRQATILTRDPDYQLSIGNRVSPTFTDYKVVNLMYKCSAHCAADPDCTGDCYVDHKCRCRCPSATDCPKRPCRNYLPLEKCDYYAANRLCGDAFDCSDSCGLCGEIRRQREKYDLRLD